MVAAGALQALREARVSVPEEVSVVGYDDVPLALDLFPALTTVNVPHEELGRAAVRLALHREELPGASTWCSAPTSSCGTRHGDPGTDFRLSRLPRPLTSLASCLPAPFLLHAPTLVATFPSGQPVSREAAVR